MRKRQKSIIKKLTTTHYPLPAILLIALFYLLFVFSCENHWMAELTSHMFCETCKKAIAKCICDPDDPVCEHDWGWTQTSAPDCTTAGIETGTCSRDSTHTTTRPIAALGHDHSDNAEVCKRDGCDEPNPDYEPSCECNDDCEIADCDCGCDQSADDPCGCCGEDCECEDCTETDCEKCAPNPCEECNDGCEIVDCDCGCDQSADEPCGCCGEDCECEDCTETDCEECAPNPCEEGHTSNNAQADNCLVPNECTVCGNEITPAKENHNYPTDDCTAPCSDCGEFSANNTHAFTGLWVNNDATQHWKECTRTGCEAVSGDGTTVSAKANHTGGTSTCTEKAICTICSASYGDLDDHNYTWRLTTYPSETTRGEETEICTECAAEGETRTFTTDNIGNLTYALTLNENNTYSIAAESWDLSGDIVIPGWIHDADGTARQITTIADNGFYMRSQITGVTIPSSVTTVGRGAFSRTGLTTVTIPASVTTIGNFAFYMCWSLKSVTIPEGVTTIGEYAFGEAGITDITIPASVTNINRGAFEYCWELTSVTFSGTSTMIANNDCFPYGSSLRSVYPSQGAGTYTRADRDGDTWVKESP